MKWITIWHGCGLWEGGGREKSTFHFFLNLLICYGFKVFIEYNSDFDTNIYRYIHTHTHTLTHTHIYIYIYIYIYVCVCEYVYIHIYIYICVCVCVCVSFLSNWYLCKLTRCICVSANSKGKIGFGLDFGRIIESKKRTFSFNYFLLYSLRK